MEVCEDMNIPKWQLNIPMMRRFGKFIPLHMEYRRIKKRFGKFVRVERIGSKGED